MLTAMAVSQRVSKSYAEECQNAAFFLRGRKKFYEEYDEKYS